MHRRFPIASFALRSRSPAPMSEEDAWMHQLAAGEPTAWARLMEQWSPPLYHYITASGVSELEAKVLLHSIFSTTVRQIVGAPLAAKLTVLIFTIAYEHIMRYCHQPPAVRRHHALPPAVQEPTTSPANQLDQLLQQFSPEVRQMALLYYLCEVNLADLSQIVRQPELVVRHKLNQVKRQLCR